MNILQERDPEELQGDVFEVLETLGDFNSFKELMLAHKQQMEGEALDFSNFITITSK
jgi:ADP-ribosylation factor 2-binding protein